jgi:RNA recognition motif-containing protein
MAKLFSRAGSIRNVTMPKYKDNFTPKGFAFVEFAEEKSAESAIQMFNNCIPLEFTDAKSQNFVHVQGNVTQLRVMPKHEWSAKKEEMKQIKREI